MGEVGAIVTYQGTRYADYHGMSARVMTITPRGDCLLLLDNGAQCLVPLSEVQAVPPPRADSPADVPSEADPVSEE